MLVMKRRKDGCDRAENELTSERVLFLSRMLLRVFVFVDQGSKQSTNTQNETVGVNV